MKKIILLTTGILLFSCSTEDVSDDQNLINEIESLNINEETISDKSSSTTNKDTDNDGINDAFQVIGSQIMNYEIWIMNRWGETVFHSTSLDDVWVGDVQGGTHFAENGIYNWIIRLKGFNTDAEEYSGTLQLMR